MLQLWKSLLINGAKSALNQKCNGSTPLDLACQNGHDAVVKLLLDTKAIPPNKYKQL